MATLNRLQTKQFEQQYKDHLSGFNQWEQKDHAERWMLFQDNIGPKLSIDEVEVTNGELYTVLTNKAAHGKKGALVGMCEGTKASEIAPIGSKIGLALNNVANSHNVVGITPGIAPTASAHYAQSPNDLLNLLPGRSVMITFTAGFAPKR